MASSTPPSQVKTTFTEATAVKQLTSHTYEAYFPDDWCIGSVPHGGFVTSTFLSVSRTHFTTTLSRQNQPDTLTLHLDFLRRTSSGPALFTVQDTKLGRQTSIIHITLTQGPRTEIVGYITHSNLSLESGLSLPTNWTPTPSPPPVSLSLLATNKDENWALQPQMPFANFRKASQKVAFHFPRKGQPMRSIADAWLRFSNGEKFTARALGYLVDMFPMPVEAFLGDENPYDVVEEGEGKKKEGGERKARAARYWYPTLLLNLDVKKKLPEEGVEWLFSRVATKRIENGRTDLEVVIMDEGGDVVALSHHVTFILGAERNLAKRRTEGEAESKI